ncbi:MAG TPA: 2-oxoacid:acceptor oxidoreductase family protein [Myxococcales bacterium]|nr:2-oxoacid:acceptor oxidoreductase family protein [Myxococcales bacterium]
MTRRAELLRERLTRGDSIDLRGHGKAGGGLMLAIQSFAAAVSEVPGLDVQDWPLFSSARKGATVCAYLRVASGKVEQSSAVSEPDVAILVNEAAAEEVDFAEGTRDALYIVNTWHSPEMAAARYRLGGTVVTIPGDELGKKYLGRPLANVAVLAALVRATGLVEPGQARESLEARLVKRRLPRRIVDANLAMFDAAQSYMKVGEFPPHEHARKPFAGYGSLPAGAQSALRTSLQNRTSGYGRPGVKVEFSDPLAKCNGCSLCVVQCPEGIIQFKADTSRGTLVYGARFGDFCKACRECVTACPLDLFREIAVVARPEGVPVEA